MLYIVDFPMLNSSPFVRGNIYVAHEPYSSKISSELYENDTNIHVRIHTDKKRNSYNVIIKINISS